MTAIDLTVGGPAYHLIVLDVMLPRRDGFAVLNAMRAQEPFAFEDFSRGRTPYQPSREQFEPKQWSIGTS